MAAALAKILVATTVVVVAAIGILATTTSGLHAIVSLVNRFAPIAIEASGGHGALTREFGFERLRVVFGGTTVEILGLRASLQNLTYSPLAFDFDSLAASRVGVKLAPSGPAGAPPQSIASPVAVSAQRLIVGELKLHLGGTLLAARSIDAAVSLGPFGYPVAKGRIDFAGQPIQLDGELGGRTPFTLAARGNVTASVQAQSVQAQWRADGNLHDFTLAADVSGGQARGKASARIGSFSQPALKSLQADIEGIDLRAWQAGLPTTRLQLQADLQTDASLSRLSGPLRIVNRDAGALDEGKIPLREARARVVLTRDEFHAAALAAELSRGRAAGVFAAQFGAAVGWQTELQLDGVDPATIHSRARPLLIDGRASASQAAGETRVHADLRNRGAQVVSALLDLRLTAEQLAIERAELALGKGRATATGSLGLKGEQRLGVQGAIERFDPGLLVKGLDALVNGSFDAQARLAPKPAGEVRFELTDSRAFGRPLTGRGRVSLDAAQLLAVDLQLTVRSVRISAVGGLGAAGRSLAIKLDAPALDELLPQLRGTLSTEAALSGDIGAPAVTARLVAGKLRLSDLTLMQAQADASYSGGADGRLSLQATATDLAYRDNPELKLRMATLAVAGPLSGHTITLHGTTAKAREVVLGAQGGWLQSAWRGLLREASVSGPLDLRLLTPSPVVIGVGAASTLEFGPAQLALVGARFDDVQLASDSAGLRTRGSFSGLRAHMLVAVPAVGIDAGGGSAGAGTRAALDWLALRGDWQLQFGALADGTLRVERSGGDLFTGNTADSAIQLRELGLEATIKANQLEARAVSAADRGGNINARLKATVEHAGEAGWRLAQTQPWQIEADANMPTLALVSSLIGERLPMGGRLAGRVSVGGTPADPQAHGTLEGDALRVAWVEQGLRLDNGRLRVRLDGDVLWLDELRFSGAPGVRPKEPRAASGVDFKQEGSLSAKGRLSLRELQGSVELTAQRLPLLQRADRWVIASGSAKIEASAKRMQINSDIKADAGYVEAAPAGLPSLSSDVVVVRKRGDATQRATEFALGFDVGINLGDRFYVTGAGLSARVEGVVRLRSAGRGAVTASGSIEAQDGRFEGMGQRLAIKRGRVNFQGPPENPSLDVLAIREGLPVEVGASITRTVNSPLIRLHSDPSMRDAEIMSWLVLGHAGDQTRADNLVLALAAAGLLQGTEEGVTERFKRSLGIDDITLRSGDVSSAGSLLPQSSVAGDLRGDRSTTPTATSEILSISKRISDTVTISYEQALSGTENVVQLSYRLSKSLSLVARAGTYNALDLVYSFAFD